MSLKTTSIIITRKEFDKLKKMKDREKFKLKVDFGLRKVEVERIKDKIILGNNFIISLKERLKDNFCYIIDKDGIRKITFFSFSTNRFYKLIPTKDWPSFSIGSVPMHRLDSPYKDTLDKIKFLNPKGLVLDTCTGLGYTAILSSQKAKKVFTFEKDNWVLKLARINPLSKTLFSSSNIVLKAADITEEICKFKDNYFDAIIHDPPTFTLAGELYSSLFYQQLYRVLKRGRRLFHYTPLYKINRGWDFPSRIKGKLKKAGFKIVKFSREMGVLCEK